jgi:hypothetical protein
MPPRHAYWTILIGNAPTAFRAHDRADLVPTFERLRQKQPDVIMKYFARGRLWDSPEDARNDRAHPPRPETRDHDWRPGGTHRDPRDRFKPKRDKPRFPGKRDRPGGIEPRGSWTPKRKPFAKSSGFGTPKPSGKSRPRGDWKPSGDRKPFAPRKQAGDRPRVPERPVEPKTTAELPKEERVESRRKGGKTLIKKVRR